MYGDIHVVRRAALGLVPYSHFGIEMPGGGICENSPPGGTGLEFADFARGRPTRIQNPDASLAERAGAVERAAARIGERRYSLSGNNCEHFVNWCATGVAISHQVAGSFKALVQLAAAAAWSLLALLVARVAFAD